nr:hypothetical protein [Tanacetum cinerariifolium]
LEILPSMVARVYSTDNALYLEATTQFHKFLSIDITSGTSENTKVVTDHGAVLILVKIFSSLSDYVREQALGNAVGDSPRCRDIVLGHAVKAKDSAKMPKPVEMPKPKPKPAAVKTKEVAEKPKPAENVKELLYLDSTQFDHFPIIRSRPAIKNWTTKNMNTRQYLEIEDEAFGKLDIYGEWSENETKSLSKEKAKVETLLRDANKEFPNDDNVKKLFEQYKGFFKETFLLEETKGQEASVKTKPVAVKVKDSAEKPKPVENVKELAEKPKEPAEKAHEAPQNVKRKPAAVKTKEAAEKPKPAEKRWLKSQRSRLRRHMKHLNM